MLMTVLSTLVAVAVLNVVPSAADPPPPPIASVPLTPRSVFPDQIDMKVKLRSEESGEKVVKVDDPSRTVVLQYTVQPGAQFPWHTHYGPVIVNIISGALTYISGEDDHGQKSGSGTCTESTYGSGQAFVDAGHGHVHSAINRGSVPVVFIATFFEAPETGPLLIPADPAC